MIGPAVTPRVKAPDSLSGTGINRGNVAPLVPIAQNASVRQVVQGGGASVLAADDMVDLMRETGVIFMDEAVFATVVCAVGDFGSQSLADFTGHS